MKKDLTTPPPCLITIDAETSARRRIKMKQDKLSEYVVALYDALENDIVNDYTLNVKAYADVFKEELEKFKKDNKIKDNNLAIALFFDAERESGVDNEDFSRKMETATLYRQLRDNNYEEPYVRNVPAYAEVFKDDLKKYMDKHKITDKNIGIAKFYIDDRERLKDDGWGDRIRSAVQYRMQKEEIERIKTPHLPNFCFCPRCGNALVRNGKFAEKVKVIKGSTVECGVCHIEIDVRDKSLDNR